MGVSGPLRVITTGHTPGDWSLGTAMPGITSRSTQSLVRGTIEDSSVWSTTNHYTILNPHNN